MKLQRWKKRERIPELERDFFRVDDDNLAAKISQQMGKEQILRVDLERKTKKCEEKWAKLISHLLALPPVLFSI